MHQQRRSCQRLTLRTHAATGNGSDATDKFDLNAYYEARVETVKATERFGHVLLLRILDQQHEATPSLLPVYIGDFECSALVSQINDRPAARPLTHDLMKNTLELLGYRVTKVRIHALVGNTYHARVHYTKAPSSEGGNFEEVDVDARPSDAINLAVRFSAPIYVSKQVATKMAGPLASASSTSDSSSSGGRVGGSVSSGNTVGGHGELRESSAEVQRSCREELLQYSDPTVLFKVQLEVAVAEERYDDAAMLRDRIEQVMASDRCLSLVVAIETALEDQRYEEAARLRDEFRRLRMARQQQGTGTQQQKTMAEVQREIQDI